jgi:hypothetical protein
MPGFSITRKSGNSLALPMQVTVDGEAYPLTGKTLRYELDAMIAGVATTLVFEEGDGLEVTDAAQGLYTLSRDAEDFALDEGQYLGALRITDAAVPTFELELPEDEAGDIWTIIAQLV